MNKTALVTTTIHEPKFLDGYVQNLRRYDQAASVGIIVIPDRKTPALVGDACTEAARHGANVTCPSLDEQIAFVRKLGVSPDWIPFDSDNRRNVGFLMALAAGCDSVISIDDDNFCRPEEDFVRAHAVVGQETTLDVCHSSDGWINLCSELVFAGSGPMPYPRGFPYAFRKEGRSLRREPARVRVALNAGLWLDDPDVDAVSRLADKPKALAYQGIPFALGPANWSPINTQNTAVSRAALAAFYYVRMGFPIEGLKIDRYGDILSGYFVQKCIRHRGEVVRVGDPICNHVRTVHNLFKDLYHELAGMVLLEALLPWLLELQLTGSSYAEAYACLADELARAAGRFRGFVFDQGGRDFLTATAVNMRTWLSAVKVIGV